MGTKTAIFALFCFIQNFIARLPTGFNTRPAACPGHRYIRERVAGDRGRNDTSSSIAQSQVRPEWVSVRQPAFQSYGDTPIFGTMTQPRRYGSIVTLLQQLALAEYRLIHGHS